MAYPKRSPHLAAAPQKVRRLRQKLRAIVAAKGWSDDQYRAWLATEFGVTSTTQLTERELVAAVRKQGGNPEAKKPAKKPARAQVQDAAAGRYEGRGGRGFAGFLTQSQADYIARLEDSLGWSSDPSRLRGFIRRQLGLPSNVTKPVEALRLREATKVITGLERLAGIK